MPLFCFQVALDYVRADNAKLKESLEASEKEKEVRYYPCSNTTTTPVTMCARCSVKYRGHMAIRNLSRKNLVFGEHLG